MGSNSDSNGYLNYPASQSANQPNSQPTKQPASKGYEERSNKKVAGPVAADGLTNGEYIRSAVAADGYN